MAWTSIPASPSKKWLYIKFTGSYLGIPANEDSLICWAYSQEYTGIILFQLNQMLVSGGTTFTPTKKTQLAAFIAKCSNVGISVGGAFGGPNVIQALIDYNTTYTNTAERFSAAISEIEWWNYSYNLPYQRQDATGTYSFYDALNMFMTYKPQLNTLGMEALTYNGFTKALDYQYQWQYPVVIDYLSTTNPIAPDGLGRYGLTINGNFTTSSPPGNTPIQTKVFEGDQVIKITNYPSPNLSSYCKLNSTTPVNLISGQTNFNISSTEISDGRLITGFRPAVPVLSYSITNYIVTLDVNLGHGVLPNTQLIADSTLYPELNWLAGSVGYVFYASSVTPTTLSSLSSPSISSIILGYQATAGTVRLTFTNIGDASEFLLNDEITVSGLPGAFSGDYIITAVASNYIEYSAAVPFTPYTISVGAIAKIKTRSLTTFASPVNFYPPRGTSNNFTTKVANLFEVTYLDIRRVAPSPPYLYEIALRGDKTYYFSQPNRVSRIAIENYNLPPGTLFDVGQVVYNAGANETRIYTSVDPNSFIGAGPEFTTFTAMANLDVVHESNSLYGAPGTELQQLMPHVDGYALTIYDQNIPNYNYIRNRVLELGAGAAFLGASPKVYYLFGAYNDASRNFYLGMSTAGGNIATPWPKKGLQEAYDYVSFDLPTVNTADLPAQNTTPTVYAAALETDSDVTANVQINGLVMFSYEDLQGHAIKNGPRVLLGPTDPLLLNTTVVITPPNPISGQEGLAPVTYCDDCLPKVAIVSRSASLGVATITTQEPHGYTSNASIVIAGVPGVDYNGVRTIIPTSGNTFTFTTTGPDEPTTPCSGTATAQTVVTWSVVSPPGGTGNMLTAVQTTSLCSTTFPNTLDYDGGGTYLVTATVRNPQVGTLGPNDSQALGEVSYSLSINGSEPNSLEGFGAVKLNNDCPGVGSAGEIEITLVSGNPNYTYQLYLGPIIPGTEIATSGSTALTTWVFTGLADGTYNILVTDSVSQTAIFTVTLAASPCTILYEVTNVSCVGGSDGQITLAIDPFDPDCACPLGGPDITWTYNGNPVPGYDGLFDIKDLPAGTYVATVVTCIGCTQVYTIEVADGTPITLVSSESFNSSCQQSNGAIVLYLNTPIDCLIPDITSTNWWSGVSGTQISSVISNISGDGTTVTVDTSTPHNLVLGQLVGIQAVNPPAYNTAGSNPSAIVTNILSPTSFTIASTATGAYVSGGVLFNQFFSYGFIDLGGGNYAVSLAGLPAGDYYFTAENDCGCTFTSSTFTLTTTDPPTVEITNEPVGGQFIICGGDASSSLIINGTGTTDCSTPLLYAWQNLTTGLPYKGNTPDTNNLTVTYPGGLNPLNIGVNVIQLTAVDCNGCIATVTTEVVVTDPLPPVTGLLVSGGPLTICPGTTQSYFVTVQGGQGPNPGITNYWSIDGTPFPSITDYPTLEVTNDFFSGPTYISTNQIVLTYTEEDAYGCSTSSYVKIDPPLPITLEITVTNIACGGLGNTGEIDVRVLNGCAPYTYTWTSTVPGFVDPGTEDLVNLLAGTYTVTVSDSAGNTVTSDPIDVIVTSPGIDNAFTLNTCNGNANGVVEFDIVNATAPFNITWTGPTGVTNYTTSNTFVSFTSLKDGVYDLLLEDANGCTYSTSFIIQPAPPIVVTPTVWVPSCFSANDGKIELTITGGVGAPYTITWYQLPGEFNNAVVSNLGAGNYVGDVTDSNGCLTYFSVPLSLSTAAPMQMTEVITNPNFETGTLGSIQITAVTNGGGAPYTYVWTDENDQVIGNGPLLDNLNDGTYTVTVTGFAGCSITRTYTLQGRCSAFSYPEYRLQLYKFQCCAGQLAKKYINLIEVGRTDLAKCLEMDLQYMTVALDRLSCIYNFPDPCLSCDDLNTIFNQLKKICDCDCCESDENAYIVSYDYETGLFTPVPELVGGTIIPPPPPPPPPPAPDQLELREDGGSELREDNGDELREN